MRGIDPRLALLSPTARRFALACLPLALLSAVATIGQALALAHLIDDLALRGRSLASVTALVGLLVTLALARGVIALAFEAGGHLAASAAIRDLRLRIARRALATGTLPRASGELANDAIAGADALDPYFSGYLPGLSLALVMPTAIVAWVAFADPTSAVLLALTVPLIPLFSRLVGRVAERRARERYRAMARLGGHFLSVVRGLPTLRAFNRGAAQVGRISEVSEEYRRTTMQTLRVAFLSAVVLELAATLGTAVVAVEIGIRLVRADIALTPALAILLLTPELYAPLRGLAAQFHASADAIGSADTLLELLAPSDPSAPARVASAIPDGPVTVRFEHVSFTYPARPARVLDRFDLELEAGERVALVGPSGAGKSTVVRLLLGFEQPTAGRLLVDGADAATTELADQRRRIAWLPQRPHLPAGTIAEAISLGSPDATFELVAGAARAAGADAFVERLPDGYATRVGDGGARLSAGELRRVALARALLRPAGLLLLDEPTTNLDLASAELVAAAIEGLPRSATVLVVTHDELFARRVCDRVVRVEPCSSRQPVPA